MIAVFEDPNCGYCKPFYKTTLNEIDNVTVYTFLYNFLVEDSAVKSRNVWCSVDRNKAWIDLMVDGKAAVSAICTNCANLRVAILIASHCEFKHEWPSIAARLSVCWSYQARTGLGVYCQPSSLGFQPWLVDFFALLMAGFIAAYQVDKRLFTWYGLPIWFIELRFKLTYAAVAAHLFAVTLQIAEPTAVGQTVGLTAWIPGNYMIRDFARNIVQIRAESNGRKIRLKKLDKHSWQAAPCEGPLNLNYQVYAWDLSVRAAHLDRTHGFFNGTSFFFA